MCLFSYKWYFAAFVWCPFLDWKRVDTRRVWNSSIQNCWTGHFCEFCQLFIVLFIPWKGSICTIPIFYTLHNNWQPYITNWKTAIKRWGHRACFYPVCLWFLVFFPSLFKSLFKRLELLSAVSLLCLFCALQKSLGLPTKFKKILDQTIIPSPYSINGKHYRYLLLTTKRVWLYFIWQKYAASILA